MLLHSPSNYCIQGDEFIYTNKGIFSVCVCVPYHIRILKNSMEFDNSYQEVLILKLTIEVCWY